MSEPETDDEVLCFKLVRTEKKFQLEDPETGEKKDYILRELDGTARDKYLNDLTSRTRFDADGKNAGMKDFTNFEATFLSLCILDGTTRKPVPIAEIQKWPSRVQTKLGKLAREISGMQTTKDTEGTKAEGKNE